MAAPKEEKIKVPGYIVTFSDMITLLLTFFVLLLSMASTQVDESKFTEGKKSIINAFSRLGLNGIIFNSKQSINLGEEGVRYKVKAKDQHSQEQSLDKKEEMTRRVFKELERLMKITPAQVTGKSPSFMPTSIQFKKGQARLDKTGQDFLDKFAYNLQENISNSSLILYVVGFAPKEPSMQKKHVVSAHRAQAAADYLRKSMPKNKNWRIHSWGAGAGGQWKTSGPAAESDVIIAVLDN